MGNTTFSWFFFPENFEKIQLLAFTDKVKIVKVEIPEKVILYIKKNLIEELNYLKKKYSIRIELSTNEVLVIPEYKIELLNKSKKY